jgi:hypothetical protein
MGGKRPGRGPDPGTLVSKNTGRLCRWSLTFNRRPASCRGLVKRDRDMRSNSPAVPSRLTLGQRCRSCTTAPGRSWGQYRRGYPPPASLVRRPARRPAPDRSSGGPGSRAGSRPGGCPAPAAPDDGWRREPDGCHADPSGSLSRPPSGQGHPQPWTTTAANSQAILQQARGVSSWSLKLGGDPP